MKKRTRKSPIAYELEPEKQRRNQSKFHTDDDEYELLAREAYPRSLQVIFEERMIGRNVRERLEKIRKAQRAAKISDERFLTPKQRRERGLPPLRGRYIRRPELAV